MIGKTKVICLCGSTRFTEQMLLKQWEPSNFTSFTEEHGQTLLIEKEENQ